MFLIVGLGNPGQKYEHTRHNVGFDVIDLFAKKQGVRIEREKDQALLGECFLGGKHAILCKPQTYMNLSGDAVSAIADYFKVPHEQILIIYDDMDLPQGNIRIRKNGSSGSHNGMRSIVARLGGEDFPRMRIGIGEKREGYDPADWVLGHYITDEEQENAARAFALAAEAIEAFIVNGVDDAMCRYNTKKQKKPAEPKEEDKAAQEGAE